MNIPVLPPNALMPGSTGSDIFRRYVPGMQVWFMIVVLPKTAFAPIPLTNNPLLQQVCIHEL
jgi:hypothetical protein